MKKIYTIILAAVATLFSTSLAFADGDSYTPEQLAAISATKTVKPIGDGSQYLLTIETFVKGYSLGATAKSNDMDIVLLLDVSGSMSGDKMTKLRSATRAFVDIIEKDAKDHKANHRISIVKFASDKKDEIGNETNWWGYNYTQIVNDFLDVTETANVSTLKRNIDALNAGGGTQAGYGMEKANDVFKNNKRDDAIRTLVMFTDGEPGDSGFSNSVASSAISSAKTMKTSGIKVYTVGLFDNGTSSDTRVNNYMMAMSSKYPNASYDKGNNNKYTWNLGQPESKDYYFSTSDAKELEVIFSKIGEDISKTGNPGINLPTNDVTLQDVVTPSFELPDGANSITLKVAQIKDVKPVLSTDKKSWSIAEDKDYEWNIPITIWKDGKNVAEEVDFKKVNVATLSGNNRTIDVTGFDFSKYWVGPSLEREGDIFKTPSTDPIGRKLIIEITVQLDPNYSGSDNQISTNDPDNSGIYVGGTSTTPIVKYVVSPATVYAPLPLKITKAGGLSLGESIIYKIERGTMVDGAWTKDSSFSDMTVALTNDTNDGALSESLGRLPARKMVDGVYVDYYYKVTEDTTWAWAHKTATASVKTQKLFDSESNYVPVSFDFATAPDTAGTIRKDEKASANEFGR